mgnify:CR=1 FL=1
MALFCEYIQELEGSLSDESYNEIIYRIRNLPLSEIDGDPHYCACPLLAVL